MSATYIRIGCCAALASALLGPLAASGQPRPLAQHTIARGGRSATHSPSIRIGPRTRFGTIVRLQANAFIMRTRAGAKLLDVDDTVPVAAGTYSYPLFVGKLVMVTGDLDRNGILHANTITRVSSLDANTPNDR